MTSDKQVPILGAQAEINITASNVAMRPVRVRDSGAKNKRDHRQQRMATTTSVLP